jgi:uracil-DNA glycosylase
MTESLDALKSRIAGCTLCAGRFAATATAHNPRPVIWFDSGARILIAGQAPGQRVYNSGRPFSDPSGDRLRDWMGIGPDSFYDRSKVSIVPMAFCFPGYDAKGADLPPPALCSRTWHGRIMHHLGKTPLTILVGGHAIRWHLQTRQNVTQAVSRWRDYAPDTLVLPHPSWRNTGWLKKNPWFEAELLPVLRNRVKEVLDDG